MLLLYYCRTVEDSRGCLNCWTIANEGRRQPVRLLSQDLPCLARMEKHIKARGTIRLPGLCGIFGRWDVGKTQPDEREGEGARLMEGWVAGEERGR